MTQPQSGWLDFKPLKGDEKSKGTSVPVTLPQGTTIRGSGFLWDNKFYLKIVTIFINYIKKISFLSDLTFWCGAAKTFSG
jgi:hypothetical protein